MIKTLNTQTNEIKFFNSVEHVLQEINRDRSDEWQDYTIEDWREGLEQFTEYTLNF